MAVVSEPEDAEGAHPRSANVPMRNETRM
jgi:hypothetical protein